MKKMFSIIVSFLMITGSVTMGIAGVSLVAVQPADASHNISGCTTITSSGTHTLTGDVTNTATSKCIVIKSSDVILEGNDHTVTGGSSGSGVFINASSSLTNITIQNLEIRDWTRGIKIQQDTTDLTIKNNHITNNVDGIRQYPGKIESSLIEGNNISNNGDVGVDLTEAPTDVTIRDNKINNNDAIGLVLYFDGSDNDVINNTMKGNIDSGLYVEQNDGNLIKDNKILNNGYGPTPSLGVRAGLIVKDSSSNKVINNEINDNNGTGLKLGGSHSIARKNEIRYNEANGTKVPSGHYNITLKDNTISDNNQAGYSSGAGVFVNGDDVDLVNNRIRRNKQFGVAYFGSDSNELENNKIENNNGEGIRLNGTYDTYLKDNTVASNSDWAIYAQPALAISSYNITADNLDLGSGTVVSFDAENIAIDLGSKPASLPSGMDDVNRYINATNTDPDYNLEIRVNYDDSATSGMVESTLSMWHYDGSWSEVSGSTVDTNNNYVKANVTSFSTIAPLGELEKPPTANFTYSPKVASAGQEITFNASDSSDPNGDITSYEWDFNGDGNVDANGKEVKHTYSSNGTYDVELTVTDSTGNTDNETKQVKIGENESPTADFKYTPSEVDAQEEITFDASSSSDPNNDIVSYEWDIAGNTATGKTTKYSFSQNGTYTVELTVTDSTGNTDTETKQIQVSEPNNGPTANFSYLPKKPDPNQTVMFDASMSSDSDGDVASYDWEFNRSGFQISGEKIEYAFNQKGMHKVTLTVTDDDGATDKKSMVVNVTDVDVNSPPQAKFMYSPKNPNVSDSIKFNASMSSDADGDSLSYEWDFGDGNTSTGEKVSHSYGSSGKYTVELTVKDGNGASDKMKMTVNVTSSKLSIEEAIANLKTQNNIVNFSELQSAISFWIQNKEVPGTGGKKIDFSKLQDLISLWVQETEV